ERLRLAAGLGTVPCPARTVAAGRAQPGRLPFPRPRPRPRRPRPRRRSNAERRDLDECAPARARAHAAPRLGRRRRELEPGEISEVFRAREVYMCDPALLREQRPDIAERLRVFQLSEAA